MAFHDANVCGVKARRVLVDEIWSLHLRQAKECSDCHVCTWRCWLNMAWTAIDADSKMTLSYFAGGGDGECAMRLGSELRQWLAERICLISDGRNAYLEAVESSSAATLITLSCKMSMAQTRKA